MKGKFITVEGGEGAGKTTQLQRVEDWLRQRGHDVVRTREPGGTTVAEKIRHILLDEAHDGLSDQAELLLVFAARAQHLAELIRPALAAGRVVLCDRFTDATWAYQGAGRGLDPGLITMLERAVHGDLQPDLTLLLDISPAQGLERATGRGDADRFEQESLEFFERVRQAYLARAESFPDRFAVIDASPGPDEVWHRIRQALEDRHGL